MKLTGAYSVPVTRNRAYDLLQDPATLSQCIPGCESLDRLDDHLYAVRMKMSAAGVAGLFACTVRLTDHKPRESFRLIVEGSGNLGSITGDGVLALRPEGGATAIKFEGHVKAGGTLAAFGQRLIESAAQLLIKRFFEALAAHTARLKADESAAD